MPSTEDSLLRTLNIVEIDLQELIRRKSVDPYIKEYLKLVLMRIEKDKLMLKIPD